MNVRFFAVSALILSAAAALIAVGEPEQPAPAPRSRSVLARSAPGAADAPSAAARAPSAFRAVGLMVNAPVRTGVDARSLGSNGGSNGSRSGGSSGDSIGTELAFFGTFARTSLAVEHVREHGGLLGIDAERSRLVRFQDDRGTDLLREDVTFGPFEMLPRVSADGRHVVFVIPSDELPDPAATRVFAEGVLALLVANEQQSFASDTFELQEGARLSAGGIDFRIESAGRSQWGEGWALTLEAERDLAAVVSWSLVLPSGKELALEPSSSLSGMGTWQQTLECERAVERAKLRITCWTDMHALEVPFEVEAGLGLR